MRSYIFISLFIVLSNLSFTQQDLFIPRNIQKAYDVGTRSPGGSPGVNYWQNNSEYKITVRVDPYKKILGGTEEITYHNNSPDTLKEIVIRLYQNILRKGSARDFMLNMNAVNEGVILHNVVIRSQNINFQDKKVFRDLGTNAIIILDEPLLPKSSIEMKIDWSFEISTKVQLRMGAYDSTSFFIAYWYPQIAVYDDIDGWDRFDYGGQVEFYNDFSSFDVEIEVPNDFCVWATGELLNPDLVLNQTYLERYQKAKSSDTVIRIITLKDLEEGNIFNRVEETNLWKFKADDVTDFTFALSDHYLWDGVSVVVDSTSLRRSFLCAAYKKESEDYYKVAEISKQAAEYFSFEMPGVPYPYPYLTIFNGSGGMEFPMMINNGSEKTWEGTVGIVSHEMSHQYFPFYMGTNEKKYAFMDEGWAVMLPFNFQERLTDKNFRRLRTVENYQKFAGNETEMPPMIPSVINRGSSYRMAAYDRPSIAYNFLREALGDSLFKKCLHEFIKRWNRKHPIPYDMFFTFNELSGKNLNWFWNPWFFVRGFPDLALDKITKTDNGYKIVVQKVGNIPLPIHLNIRFEDETEEVIYYKASVWKERDEEFIIDYKTAKVIREVKIGSKGIPDSNQDNNLILIH